jgi:outer membrane protein OmpA-like peptidoglycan-associated protein
MNGSRSGKEVAMLVGVLLLVVAGTMTTYWARSKGAEAQPEAPAPAAPPPETAPIRAVASAPTGLDVIHGDVYFDLKSTRLRADAVRLLQEGASAMEGRGTWVVLVQGYADRQGPPEYNRALARRRAEIVKRFLVELGVPEAAVRVVAVGQEGALCADASETCLGLDRRVHVEMRRLTRAVTAPVRPAIVDGDGVDATAGATVAPTAAR